MNNWAHEYLIKSAAGVDTTDLLEKLAGLGAALARNSAAAVKRMAGKTWNPAAGKLNIAAPKKVRTAPPAKSKTVAAPPTKSKAAPPAKSKTVAAPPAKSKSKTVAAPPTKKRTEGKGGKGGKGEAGGEAPAKRQFGLGSMGLAGAGGLGVGLGAGLLARGRSSEE